MRYAIALLLACAGCPGSNGGECTVDRDCGSNNVCARNAECLPAGEVRVARIMWTTRGQPANAMLCAPTPDFYLLFAGTQINDTFGYQPVPCDAGLFVVDKLPRRFVSVEIGEENGFSEVAAFDAQGNAAFDLAP
jgi:hypothetical protein